MEDKLFTINTFIMASFVLSVFVPHIFKNIENEIARFINNIFMVLIYHVVFVWALFFALYNGFKAEPRVIMSFMYYFISVICFYYIGWGDIGRGRDEIIKTIKRKLFGEDEDEK